MLRTRRFFVSLTLMVATAISAASAVNIVFGVSHVGGREIERTGKPGDTVWVEQAMVHTLIPSEVTGAPVVMVPGMGLGGFIYLGTPDGRKGWAQLFAEAGHPVHVYDIPEYSTSGGFTDDEADTVNAFAALLDGIPFLSVYADYIDERGQTKRKALSQAITDAILQRGGVAGFIDLPAQEVFGNTHLMMQDNNNEFIAAQIMDWIDTHVDTQTKTTQTETPDPNA